MIFLVLIISFLSRRVTCCSCTFTSASGALAYQRNPLAPQHHSCLWVRNPFISKQTMRSPHATMGVDWVAVGDHTAQAQGRACITVAFQLLLCFHLLYVYILTRQLVACTLSYTSYVHKGFTNLRLLQRRA